MSETEHGITIGTRECPYCDWETEKPILTDLDNYDLDERAERHYERAHCGTVKVQVTLEAEWLLHPGQDTKKMSRHALERFEDEPTPGFEAAFSSVETIEECSVSADTEQEDA